MKQKLLLLALSNLFPNLFPEKLTEAFGKLPIVRVIENGGELSFYLLCEKKVHVGKFFFDFITTWLMPGKRLEVEWFYFFDFSIGSSKEYTLVEVTLGKMGKEEKEGLKNAFSHLEEELQLALSSSYQADQILQMKGASGSERTLQLQELVAKRVSRLPQLIDLDLYKTLHVFLGATSDEFRSARLAPLLARLIFALSSFEKKLEQRKGSRSLQIKFLPVQINHPFGIRRGLGILAGLNLLHERERFNFSDFFHALKKLHPSLDLVEDALLTFPKKNERFFFYFELTKKGGEFFSLKEKRKLYFQIQKEIKSSIMRWIRPLFMPRNEEEIAKYWMALNEQVKKSSDLPHIILQFDRQTERNLIYTAVCVRIRGMREKPLDGLVKQKYRLERYRSLGAVGSDHIKEGAVFQIYLPIRQLIRYDQTLDVYKGRKIALDLITKMVGEVRDYNGGMIAKQEESLKQIKDQLPPSGKKEGLLEQYFHSIYPFEQKSILSPKLLRRGYLTLKSVLEKEKSFFCQNKEGVFYTVMKVDPKRKEKMLKTLETWKGTLFQIHAYEAHYIGAIFAHLSRDKKGALKRTLLKLSHPTR